MKKEEQQIYKWHEFELINLISSLFKIIYRKPGLIIELGEKLGEITI